MNPNMMNNFMQRLNYLKQTFKGDPNQKIQELLNSGKVTQQDYDNAVRNAKELQSMFGRKF
jgi:hypothetical protein